MGSMCSSGSLERAFLTCDLEKVGALLLDHAITLLWRKNATPMLPPSLSKIWIGISATGDAKSPRIDEGLGEILFAIMK